MELDPGNASIVFSDISIFCEFSFEVSDCSQISFMFFFKVIFEVLSEFSILVEYNIY